MKEKDFIENIIDDIRQSTFHMTDEEAIPVIDEYLASYPELLELHERDWYHKYC